MSKIKDLQTLWSCVIKKYYIFHIIYILLILYSIKSIGIFISIPFLISIIILIGLVTFIASIIYVTIIYLYKNLRYNTIEQVQLINDKLILTNSHFFTKKTIEITLNSLEKIASESCEQELVFTSSSEKQRFLIANNNKKEITATLLKLDCPFYYELPDDIFIDHIETVDETVKLHTITHSIIGTNENTVQFAFDDIKAIDLSKPYLYITNKGKAVIYVGENKAHIFKFFKGIDNTTYNELIALKKELGIYYG